MHSPIKKQRGGSSSSAAIIGWNYDLLIQILVLLPVKAAVRFKLVSKFWQLLLVSEKYCRLHLLNQAPETQHSFILCLGGGQNFFICNPTEKNLVPVKLPCINHQDVAYMEIAHSCNGLLLLIIKIIGDNSSYYHVFNPTTMRLRVLFKDLEVEHKAVEFKACLIFDPTKSEHYKVAVFSQKYLNFSVYDSATHCCYRFRGGAPGCAIPYVGKEFLSDVKVLRSLLGNFLRTRDLTNYLGLNGKFPIHSFSVHTADYHYVESNGHLYACRLARRGSDDKYDFVLEEMVEHYQWVVCKKATLDFKSTRVDALGVVRAEKAEDSVFLFHVPGKIMIYRLFSEEEEECEVLVDYTSDDFYEDDTMPFHCYDGQPFVHTLASV